VLSLLEGTLLLVVLVWGSLALSRALERRLAQTDDLAPSARALLGLTMRIALVSLSVVIGLNSVGIDLTALAVLSGAVGIGIGFGLQKVISNLVSGVILLLDRSIKPGDVIQLDDTFGWITHLGARYVSLVTRDGKEYLVPNEDLITHKVVNWSYSDDLVRIETYIRAAHDADPHAVRRVAVEAALRARRVQAQPPPVCHLRSFGDSSLEYLLRFWIRDPKNGVENVTGEVLLQVWDAFQAAGLRVPYPQQEIRVHAPVIVARGADP
jgi:small-conductance mechanosensitive channel